MANKIYNVLFVCTGNSARSILAEGLMNDAARGRFKAAGLRSFRLVTTVCPGRR